VQNKLRYKHAFYPLQPTSVNHSPLTPELNPSAQRCLARFSTADFASLTVHFVNTCVKNQQMKQLFIQSINYVWQLLHVSALYCHLHGAFLVPSERCSIDEQSIEYFGWGIFYADSRGRHENADRRFLQFRLRA
jgi:hypothetical protein